MDWRGTPVNRQPDRFDRVAPALSIQQERELIRNGWAP
jgi:hypothetical protein